MNQTLLTVNLPKDGAPGNLSVILAAIFFSLVRQNIFQRSIGTQVKQPYVSIDAFKCRKASLCIDVRFDIDGSEPLWKFPNFGHIIIFFDMLPGTCNRQEV